MRIQSILVVAIVLAVVGNPSLAAESSSVAVSVTAMRQTYHFGEPIALNVSIHNTGNIPFQAGVAYPRFIGINFVCPGHVKAVGNQHGAMDICLPLKKLPPDGEMRFVIALNRYLCFSEPGRYTVKYRSDGVVANYSATGEFVVELSPGAIDEEWVKELASLLKKKTSLTRKVGVANPEPITKEEAIELLSWTDTPAVIGPLLEVTDDLPNSTARIVETLRKFFKQDERARKGILEFGRQGDAAFRTALAIYDEEHVTVPRDWLKSVLASQATGMRYFALEYLRKRGTKDDVSILEPAINCDNPQIAALATTVAKELRDRPPTNEPPATPSEKETQKRDN